MGERVPQHIQNQVIRDYCLHNELDFLLSSTEYAMKDCHLILEQALDNLGSVSGIVSYSLFQLPKRQAQRKSIYNQLLKKKQSFLFRR